MTWKTDAGTAPALNTTGLTAIQLWRVGDIDNEWCQLWESVELKLSQASTNVRAKRDRLLANSDWVVTKNLEQGTPIPLDWLNYRQSLRDITEQEGFPYSVVWPTSP